MKHPQLAALAQAAFDKTGAKTHDEFCALFPGDAIPKRTFRYWLAGERPASPPAMLILREVASGWLPKVPA